MYLQLNPRKMSTPRKIVISISYIFVLANNIAKYIVTPYHWNEIYIALLFYRALGFYRVPPTAGRRVNMTYDLKRLADHKLAKTFFKSPGMKYVYVLFTI